MSTVIDGSAGVTTNAGGSVNPSTNVEGINYSCRAWVNFNGTGTPAIRGSGNVSSITDNGTGDYTINFTTAMPDTNYCPLVGSAPNYGVRGQAVEALFSGPPWTEVAPTTSSFRFAIGDDAGASFDPKYVTAAVFR
jgi:hypothetical protein